MERVALQHEDGGFLCQDAANRWLKIKDPQQALRLSRKKAENVLKSNIRPGEQGQWRIVPESGWQDKRAVPMLGDVNWGQLLLQIGEMCQDIEEYSRYLQRLHSEADLEICDLLHYIEFSLLNAAKGY